MLRRRAAVFLVAFVHYAYPTLPALALPPIDFCEKNPDSPLCEPVDPDPDPVDPCADDPASCPVDPEPDPCVVDPAACEPEPDPCEVDPASCEPEPEPSIVTFGTLTGSMRVKGRGFNEKRESPVTAVLAEEAFQMLSHATCLSLVGSIEPKPRNPAKAEVFLDDPSESTLAQLVGAFAADAAGETPGTPVGQSVKITLKVEDGTALLKIKGAVLFDGIGKVAFKAKYSGAVENGSIPELPVCM